MKVAEWEISKIKPYANNPRQNENAVDKVAASIQEFGWQQPIVVDKDGVIIVGHTRWKAAQQLGLASVPVHVAEELTEEQAKAYRLVDNKTSEFSGWDFNLLNEELEGLDMDLMEAFGFDNGSFEEAKYEEQPETKDEHEQPGSRVIIAAVSLFGRDSEKIVIADIEEENTEKLLEILKDGKEEEAAEKIKAALEEMIA